AAPTWPAAGVRRSGALPTPLPVRPLRRRCRPPPLPAAAVAGRRRRRRCGQPPLLAAFAGRRRCWPPPFRVAAFPGRRASGHPAPGEPVAEAAARRLSDELGVREVALHPLGVYVYQAVDPQTGRVEHEYDHVLVGQLPAGDPPVPDPAEVAATRWVPAPLLRT